jgi:hypothetical protein
MTELSCDQFGLAGAIVIKIRNIAGSSTKVTGYRMNYRG